MSFVKFKIDECSEQFLIIYTNKLIASQLGSINHIILVLFEHLMNILLHMIPPSQPIIRKKTYHHNIS